MQPLIVLMGVSGSGKTTVGELVATALNVSFVDADDLHPESNVRKMAAGHPLTDDDRWPWLQRVGESLQAAADSGLVMACSALKRAYRDAILAVEPRTIFVLLDGAQELLAARLSEREGHFMPASLLESQMQTLERFEPDEPGIVVSIEGSPRDVADRVLRRWRT